MLKPGLHTAVMVGLDFNKLEQHMIATYRVNNVPANGKVLMIKGRYDFIDWHVVKPKRSERKRHKKAKPQPNCGPRGKNPW